MATAIDIGGLKINLGLESAELEKSAREAEKRLREMNDQIRGLDGSLSAAGTQFVNFAGKIATVSQEGRTLRQVFTGTFKDSLNDTMTSIRGLILETERLHRDHHALSGNLRANSIQFERLGLAGAQATSVLKKMGDDYVQFQQPQRQVIGLTGQLALTTGQLSSQMGALGPAASSAAASLQMLTMGGVAGAIVLGATAALTAIHALASGMIALGENVRVTNMSLLEYQNTQKALERIGGLSSDAFARGTETLAKNLYDATQHSTTLSKYLKENNIEYEKGGKLTLSTNDALRVAANLIKNATDGAQQLRIASAFGLGKEWIPALEQGGKAIDELITKLPAAGRLIDTEMIQKAREFDRQWRLALDATSSYLKSWTVSASQTLAGWVRGISSSYIAPVLRMVSSVFDAAKLKEIADEMIRQAERVKTETDGIFGASFNFDGSVGDGPRQNKTKDPPADTKSTESLQRRLDNLRIFVSAENAVYEEQHKKHLKDLDAVLAAKLIKETEYGELRTKLIEKLEKQKSEAFFNKFIEDTLTEGELLDHRYQKKLETLQKWQDQETGITQQAEDARKRIREKYAMDTLQLQANVGSRLASIVDTSMSAITSIVGDQSKKGFTIFKAISMATALVHGFSSALAAYRAGIEFGALIGNPVVGQAMGISFAAIAAAGTGAMIAKIAGVGPNSTGSPSGVTGGGASAPAISSGGGGAEQGSTSKTIVVDGLGSNKNYSDREIRELIRSIEEYRNDGDIVIVN